MGVVKYSGPIASFHCPTEATIRSLKVHFNPKQLGSGTPSPENVREIEGWNGVQVYRNDSTINYEFGVLGKNKLPITANMEIKSVNTNYNNTLQRDMTPGILYPNVSANNYWLGTSTKTFVQEVQNGSITFQANNGSYGIGTIVSVRPQVIYTISYTTSDNQVRMRIGYYDANGYFTGTHQVVNSGASFTVPNDAYHMIIVATPSTDYYNQSITVSNLQLELGSTATAYEPYDPNKTVYGGWVDLVSGKVMATYLKYVFNSSQNWTATTRVSKTGGYYFYRDLINQPTYYCSLGAGQSYQSKQQELFTHGEIDNPYSENKYCAWVFQPNSAQVTFRVSLPDSLNITTSSQFKDWLDEQGEVAIVYPLATPQEYFLAPIALKTFLSTNNVWSNADYVEVEYDLHETQDILARKQFIVANQPHIEKLAAAPLQNFVTDMTAPLKECKVYFNPIQEGEGTPSPNNGMAITGWNEMTISQSQGQVIQDATNEDWTVGWLTAGGILNASASYRTSDYIPVSSGATVKIKFTNQTSERKWYCIAYYDSQKKFLVRNNQGYTTEDITCTVSYEGLAYIRISINRASDVLISVGPITTDLIDWSSTGTVYGGYVDLVRGRLFAEWKYISGANLTWIKNEAGYAFSNVRSDKLSDVDTTERFSIYVYSSHYAGVSFGARNINGTTTDNEVCIHSFGKFISIRDSTFENMTIEDISTALADVQFVYKLATPIEYTLTPAQLKSLRGTNNIWSNANGNIELSYWKH